MATTYPLPTLAATVTAEGITAPAFDEILTSLQATFQSIYGTDAYIPADSQDGQLLAAVAKAISDSNDATIAVYNSFSPSTGIGRALSNNVALNGIARAVPTKGTVQLNITGDIGTIITDGVAADAAGARWLLPASVTIPPAGFILVTATAEAEGLVAADVGTITVIQTPTLGWQTVSNPSAASPGAPVELDAALRRRQKTSTALSSFTVLDGVVGNVAALDGVLEVRGYENDADATDTLGLPEHSMAIVVDGGIDLAIATVINAKKAPGTFTYGTTSIPVTSVTGIPQTIRFFRPTLVPIRVAITVKALTGYSTAVGNQIKQAIADYINGLSIGQRVDLGRLYLPAQFFGGAGSETFEVNVLQISINPAAPASADVDIAFNAMATCDVANITLTAT